MNKIIINILSFVFLFSVTTTVNAAKPQKCTDIKDDILTYSAGHYLLENPTAENHWTWGLQK